MVRVAVIGSGVIGLAISRRLARAGYEVIGIEKNRKHGMEVSSRSSEVIHAGLYYPQDSKKAEFCVSGRKMLYEFCKTHNVPHRTCGKLVVATSRDEEQKLHSIFDLGKANGVSDIKFLSHSEITSAEPLLKCTAAFFSPSTGIVDSHALMLALRVDAEKHGATFCFSTSVIGATALPTHVVLQTRTESNNSLIDETDFDYVINAAGLGAIDVANAVVGSSKIKPYESPVTFPKGSYFQYNGGSVFNHLVYPVPTCLGGLGIHSTIDVRTGSTRFGPDIEWVSDKTDLSVSTDRLPDFVKSIKSYYPAIRKENLVPDYAGIRPKVVSPEMKEFQNYANHDFQFHDSSVHGIHNVLNLIGIESPGLTSCLAIADHVFQKYMPPPNRF